jgi:hypothetical protein
MSTARVKRIQQMKREKHDKLVDLLHRNRFGNSIAPSGKNIYNLSSYKLSPDEVFVLSHGLNFSIPPKAVCREEVLAEFEVLAGQLKHRPAKSVLEIRRLKTKLSDLAYAYSGNPVDRSDFAMRKEFYHSLRNLKQLDDVVITKPDKGTGVVLLDKTAYIAKMSTILGDTSKFVVMGPIATNDNTVKIENTLRKRLCELVKSKKLPEAVKEIIRPTGSQRPRMYGLPKTHKPGVPLRPILSMIGSAQHKVAQWLKGVLQPVLDKYSGFCVKDSYSFVQMLRTSDINENMAMCSFDVRSLFTNVPLQEVLDICINELFAHETYVRGIQKEVMQELLTFATTDVEFSFNDVAYKQVDGVAMGSPLGPILANIFVGYLEEKLFRTTEPPIIYVRYVDDVFAMFKTKQDSVLFLEQLNSLHPSLQFTCEHEVDCKLPFLDVLIERTPDRFITSVYRKPTFSGQYIRWSSFCTKRRKLNLIATLTHRAKKICSEDRLPQELDSIRSLLATNGYPHSVVQACIQRTLNAPDPVPVTDRPEQPVILRLPYIGNVCRQYEKNITEAVARCYEDTKLRVIFTSRGILPSARKDVLPIQMNNNVIYKFACHCDKWYIGRTSCRLSTRIDQHVPACVRSAQSGVSTTTSTQRPGRNQTAVELARERASMKSAIAEHLLHNDECLRHYNRTMFSVVARGRNEFHLQVLESTFIAALEPVLCKQKKFVYELLLF